MANRKKENPIEKAQPAGTDAVTKRDPADVSTYRILNRSEEDIIKALGVFQHNLRGQKLNERDLPRVKTPPQGITIWSIPSTEGDIHTEEMTGILVEYTTPRAYWDKPMEPGSVAAPTCSSPDGIRGSLEPKEAGGPGGPGHLCPLSKFGSDPREDSNAPACKEKRMLFMLRPESLLPLVVQTPSTSIRNVFDYTIGLGNEETLFNNVYTELTLEKINAGSIDYSKVVLKNIGPVPAKYHPQLESYQEGLSKILSTQEVEVMPDAENVVEVEAESLPDEAVAPAP